VKNYPGGYICEGSTSTPGGIFGSGESPGKRPTGTRARPPGREPEDRQVPGRGAYEAALVGTPHAFDPCVACAAHILDADGNPVVEVKVQ